MSLFRVLTGKEPRPAGVSRAFGGFDRLFADTNDRQVGEKSLVNIHRLQGGTAVIRQPGLGDAVYIVCHILEHRVGAGEMAAAWINQHGDERLGHGFLTVFARLIIGFHVAPSFADIAVFLTPFATRSLQSENRNGLGEYP